jgi:hypothetical protein
MLRKVYERPDPTVRTLTPIAGTRGAPEQTKAIKREAKDLRRRTIGR